MKTYVIVSAILVHEKKYLIGKRANTKKFAPGKWEFIVASPERKLVTSVVSEFLAGERLHFYF